MKYRVEYSERAIKDLKKLDSYTKRLIKSWIEKHLEGTESPKSKGKPLAGNRSNQWRYRIGDYRLICLIKENELIILTLSVGHRRDVYK